MVKDPVCGMEVDPKKSDWVAEYGGKTYYFCSEGCMRAFNTHPSKYLERNSSNMHSHNHGSMGGCCGMGMGFGHGWMRYLYLGFFVLYLISLILR